MRHLSLSSSGTDSVAVDIKEGEKNHTHPQKEGSTLEKNANKEGRETDLETKDLDREEDTSTDKDKDNDKDMNEAACQTTSTGLDAAVS
ncbi:hypothetical protein CHS0354_033433 [Potamilus streckersoni]|uniref:Uncharacterized protein n=1 Tax=Potamilus streckersoni TaxID=2493646 RepID=A0AAE0VUR9_9BIVA|nr:hypothetical protein CHS0354_033433 [Potamilus streckersoni]